jgi:hypothetical protein
VVTVAAVNGYGVAVVAVNGTGSQLLHHILQSSGFAPAGQQDKKANDIGQLNGKGIA